MNQIRIFTASNQISVMEEVNEFLKDLEQNKLIDIKYSMVVKGNEIFYSAMMMYEEDENNDDVNFDTLE
ncbi:MAG TPA: sporulation protein Cse60 [Candidatus Sulfopaludibacter sp.]|nr:sporulation protein Cse60 [Candidatus Sulfopaludibacter sp.]